MQERQVTVEGETFVLPAPFHVLATANPIEYEGTYPLPEAQLDRFLLRVSFGYPTSDEEYAVVTRRLARRREEVLLDRITDAAGVLAMQEAVEGVVVDESVGRYCVALVVATREHPDVLTGSSPRGSLGLVLAARAFALLRGRDYVIPEDVKAVARSVLSHRITVKPELWMTQASGRRVVDAVLGQVPTPTTLRGPER
jgi:MoxR-like ATPase